MPPAWNRLAAKEDRPVCTATGPSVARNTRGRAPVAASCRSERDRSASNACALRTLGRPPPGGSGAGSRRTAGSARLGNSLTPVTGSRRCARSSLRAAQVRAIRSPTSPDDSAAACPPARSISWNQAQAARASSSVRLSTYQEPPAGSITRARCDSSTRIAWVLRAIRRAKASGRPSALSKGCTVTASAPPTPAARQATVPRSMFTQGSRSVAITDEVTACWRCAAPSPVMPLTSATRDQSRRAARSLAMVVNWSAVAA